MAEYTTPVYGYTVTVDKVGGGTPGRAYTGDWTVTVVRDPGVMADDPPLPLESQTITTGTPKTHRQVAMMAFDFATAGEW